MILNPEDGLRILGEDRPAVPTVEAQAESVLPADVQSVVRAALAGVLPRAPGWTPPPGVPQNLAAQHIGMIFDRAAGFTQREIATKFEVTELTVCHALQHPDAQTILGAILGTVADQVSDMQERIRGYAHEALTTLVQTMRTTEEDSLKASIARDMLDRAGYGARKQMDAKVEHAFTLPAEVSTRVSEAATEARRVANADYTRYLRHMSQEGGSAPLLAPSAAEGGSSAQAGKASLADSSETDEAEAA